MVTMACARLDKGAEMFALDHIPRHPGENPEVRLACENPAVVRGTAAIAILKPPVTTAVGGNRVLL